MPDAEPLEPREQSAVIPYRVVNGDIQIALITSSSGRRWVAPKGSIDPGESADEAAAREAIEEAGLVGSVSDKPVGQYTYKKSGLLHEVEVYLLAVSDSMESWDEDKVRTRQWMTVAEAADLVYEPVLKRLIRKVPGLLPDVS